MWQETYMPFMVVVPASERFSETDSARAMAENLLPGRLFAFTTYPWRFPKPP